MKRIFNYIAATVFAISLFSCAELEELNNGQDVIESGQKVKLILNANKGELKSSADTKVFVGQASNGKVVYYWNENDKIGLHDAVSAAVHGYGAEHRQRHCSRL